MTEETAETLSAALYSVAVRLPPFWPDRTAVCFPQAEAEFELAFITHQRTKSNYGVAKRNQQQAAVVEHIITSPPQHDPYNQL